MWRVEREGSRKGAEGEEPQKPDFGSETKGDHFISKVIIKSDDHLIIFRF